VDDRYDFHESLVAACRERLDVTRERRLERLLLAPIWMLRR
jgi:hypothetical protein